MAKFRLIMIAAMNENGGNTLHRYFDGHPELYVYPFESQLGTRFTHDYLASVFQHKYRWPQFELEGNFAQDYDAIWDQELKTRVNQPQASKFKDVIFEMDDQCRKQIFLNLLKGKKRTRANIIEAFFVATFSAWKNYKKSGKEKFYLGYSPCLVVDADKIINDFPDSHVIHIVRNPYSAYAETKCRPVPQSLIRYIWEWNINQLYAVNYRTMYPNNVHLVRFEDLLANPEKFFITLCRRLGIKFDQILTYPSWNRKKLTSLYPWGTILKPTTAYNQQKACELTRSEKETIKCLTQPWLKHFEYEDF